MSGHAETKAPTTLSSYLGDHLAGSKAGIELVENIQSENEGTPLGAVMRQLATEIESDSETLESIMARLGIEPSRVKQAVGWMGERLSRLRLSETVTRSAHTTRLMQLETLSLGIEGKRLLWKVLQQVPQAGPGGGGIDVDFDFDRLVTQAESQRQQIEPFRLEAAAAGLT
ncbi:MAG TPA: hypothetical protein VM942_01845 [Acidimicrobiales bacterium]|nr:hypothetical protein [Acidimicrobiales bacterium]